MKPVESHAYRLKTLYGNYFETWCTLFGVPAISTAPTPLEQREQRWESEGGRLGAPKL
jgi:hypothetical protein